MNNEFANIAGKTEQLVRTLQDKYGIAKGEAKRQVDEFKKIVKRMKKSVNKPNRLQKSSSKKIKFVKKTSKKRSK
ncbi:MAG: hypothetical protein Q8L88_06230 [Bacteroidota bacterium]|nr:hypothetical protein [Bacteroidota bacterium]